MATNISHWLKVHSRWLKKLHICEKVYFDQHFGFSKISFIITSQFSNVPYLNMEELVDTTIWLKPLQKSISFGSSVFCLAKVLATTNSEPGFALPPQMKILNTFFS